MQVLLTWPITYSANEWGILNGSHAMGFHDTYSLMSGLDEAAICSSDQRISLFRCMLEMYLGKVSDSEATRWIENLYA